MAITKIRAPRSLFLGRSDVCSGVDVGVSFSLTIDLQTKGVTRAPERAPHYDSTDFESRPGGPRVRRPEYSNGPSLLALGMDRRMQRQIVASAVPTVAGNRPKGSAIAEALRPSTCRPICWLVRAGGTNPSSRPPAPTVIPPPRGVGALFAARLRDVVKSSPFVRRTVVVWLTGWA